MPPVPAVDTLSDDGTAQPEPPDKSPLKKTPAKNKAKAKPSPKEAKPKAKASEKEMLEVAVAKPKAKSEAMKRPSAAPKSLKRPAAKDDCEGDAAASRDAGSDPKILRAYREYYKKDNSFGIKLLVEGQKKREVMKVGLIHFNVVIHVFSI